ncbi:MAG: Gfo/Idh/MocA family oxidoreductase [Burkholderiaceae bacterium]
MANKRVVGVIGLGMASLPHAKSLQALSDRIDVKGVFSPGAERRQAFAERFVMPAVDNVEAIVDNPDISAVLLLTPPNARQNLVEALCASGKHILMEKPVERTTAGAMRIVQCCAEADVQLGMVFQHRFREASQALRTRIERAELGDIHAVQLAVPWWRPQTYYDEPGRGTYERDGGGVLINQAIHSLDLMLSLTGPVSEVASIAGTTGLHQMESEDFVGAGLRFESGAIGSLMTTTASFPGNTESLTISGSKASATLAGGELRVDFQDGRKEHVGETTASGGGADPMDFPHHWHQALIEDFLDALDAGREPRCTGRQALDVHHLIDALMLSSKEKRHVSVQG